jgi:hypothetical protein
MHTDPPHRAAWVAKMSGGQKKIRISESSSRRIAHFPRSVAAGSRKTLVDCGLAGLSRASRRPPQETRIGRKSAIGDHDKAQNL